MADNYVDPMEQGRRDVARQAETAVSELAPPVPVSMPRPSAPDQWDYSGLRPDVREMRQMVTEAPVYRQTQPAAVPATETPDFWNKQMLSALGFGAQYEREAQKRQKQSDEMMSQFGKATEEESRVKAEYGQRQGALQEELARKTADVKTRGAQAERALLGDYQTKSAEINKLIAEPFAPTKDSLPDILGLFGSIAVMGALAGKGPGGNSGLASLSAMTGMINGWSEGRADLYQREKDKFEANQKVLQNRLASLDKELDTALKMAATDLVGFQNEVDLIAAKFGADQLREAARREGVDGVLKFKQAAQAAMQQSATHYANLASTAYNRAASAQMSMMRAGFGVGESSTVKKYFGVNLDAKQSKPVVDTISALSDGEYLKQKIGKNPELVGRVGQAQQWWDRYINSIRTGSALPDDRESGMNQEALRFAKEYASYLTRYEQALAGGARGFTVSFQARFNKLMEQNQFNAAGLTGLLNDMQRELINGGMKYLPNSVGGQWVSAAQDYGQRVQSGLSGGAPAAAPSASGGVIRYDAQGNRIDG
jgi:hypothetical protein